MPIRSVLAVDGRNPFIITVIQTYRGLCGMGFLCFGFFTIVFGDFNLFLYCFQRVSGHCWDVLSICNFLGCTMRGWKTVHVDEGGLFSCYYAES